MNCLSAGRQAKRKHRALGVAKYDRVRPKVSHKQSDTKGYDLGGLWAKPKQLGSTESQKWEQY